MDASTRIGIYWAISCAGFALLFLVALWRYAKRPTRERVSIIAFGGAWATICGQTAIWRFSDSLVLTNDFEVELIRLAGCLSLVWLIAEYVVAPRNTPWDGETDRRSGLERRNGWRENQ